MSDCAECGDDLTGMSKNHIGSWDAPPICNTCIKAVTDIYLTEERDIPAPVTGDRDRE